MKKVIKTKTDKICLLLSIASVCMIIIVWYVCIDILHLKPQTVFPGPVKVLQSIIRKITIKAPDGATLIGHTLTSLKVAFTGYGLGILVGLPLGIAMAWNKWADRFIRPLFDLIRPVPGLAWIPVFILLFGIGLIPKAMVIFLGAFVPCTVNSYTGIRQTQEVHLWVGDVFGASNRQKLFKIAVPSATPMIFTGLRVAMGSSWTALVGSEMLASSQGLGFMIQNARSIARPDLVIVGMLVIGVIGAIFDGVLRIIELRVAKGMNAN
jgi:NitT/TauT family transport system permease protein/taurine transport system permease protein